MARSEAATLDVHLGAINRTERRVEAELVLAERRIFPGLQRAQHLTGECFVDFIEIEILQRQAGAVEHARDGVGGRHQQTLMLADRKSTRLNSSHYCAPRMPSSA